MSSAKSVCDRLEGFLGSVTNTYGNPDQFVAEWVKMAKQVVMAPGNRDKEDWNFKGTTAALSATEQAIEASAGTFYGGVGVVLTEAEDVTFSVYNHANPTVAAGDLNDGGNLVASWVVRADSATVTKYGGILCPGGIYCDTYINIAATQRDEGAIAGTDQAYVLYRES
jgi:hypothetical protein